MYGQLGNAIIGFGRITHFLPADNGPQNTAPAEWYSMVDIGI
jgi:hypothetical protein